MKLLTVGKEVRIGLTACCWVREALAREMGLLQLLVTHDRTLVLAK